MTHEDCQRCVSTSDVYFEHQHKGQRLYNGEEVRYLVCGWRGFFFFDRKTQ